MLYIYLAIGQNNPVVTNVKLAPITKSHSKPYTVTDTREGGRGARIG